MVRWMASAAAMVVCGLVTMASAAPLVTSPGTTTFRNDMTGTVGFDFQLSAPIEVGALGFIDAGLDGLASEHTVGLWGPSGLIAEVVVPAGTVAPLEGEYRYQALPSPITLDADTVYTLGAHVFNGGDTWRDSGNSADFDSVVASTTARWTTEGSAGYTKPTYFGNGSGYLAPNLQIVPEPAALGLIGLGGLMMLRRRR